MKNFSNIILFSAFLTTTSILISPSVKAGDRFSEMNSIAPVAKHQELLSESKAADHYMTMWIKGPVSRALRLNKHLIPYYEKLTTHNDLTNNGIKSVLQNITEMGIKEDILNNNIAITPYIQKNIKLTERKVIDGVLTWTFEIPVDIDFQDPSLRSQHSNKKPYVFLVRAVRSNEPHHKQRMALDHIEKIK